MPSSQTPLPGSCAVDPTSVRPALDDAEVERVERGDLRARLIALRQAGASMLLDLGAVDYLERVPRFDVVYHLLFLPVSGAKIADVACPRRMRILVGISADDAMLPSVVDLWPNADWAEREVFDLFGIRFEGHPNLTRIQMPADWEGHPLRKDYPVRGFVGEATPRPSFASKSNVPAGTPPSGRVAEALREQVSRATEKSS
ncbi:MAG TPA: NADH-quinone oxidoreductase subunit C [Candidatus Baltobacteraceae bacterium]|nr:NADH-quinone oxidoreductase subunit C [Candidatus Baltobacteraceae bacterium]